MPLRRIAAAGLRRCNSGTQVFAFIEKVLRACAKHDVAVEINAHPWRLDLNWRWHQAALDFGCMMSINPDAHSIPELDHMHWGVEMARKGGVSPEPRAQCHAARETPSPPTAQAENGEPCGLAGQ